MFGADTCLMPVKRVPRSTTAIMPQAVSQYQKKIFRKSRVHGHSRSYLRSLA